MKKLIATIFTLFLCFSIFAQEIIVLRDNAPLRIEKNGVLEWSTTVPAGTSFDYKNPVSKDVKMEKEVRKDVKCFPVKYQEKDYFISEAEVVVAGGELTLGAINENAVLYEKAKPSSFRNAILEPGTLVVTLKDSSNKNKNKLSFKEVFFWDSKAWEIKQRFVQTKKVTVDSNDVKAVRFAERSDSFKDDKMKKEFISKALDSAKSEKIKDFIQKKYNAVFGIQNQTEETTIEIEELPKEETKDIGKTITFYTADGDNINVRNKPSLKSTVVGKVANGGQGYSTVATIKEDTIDGITSSWYRITTPGENSVDGWIFGGYLKINE